MIVLAVILLVLLVLLALPVAVTVQYDNGDALIRAGIGPCRKPVRPARVGRQKDGRPCGKKQRGAGKAPAAPAGKKLTKAQLRPLIRLTLEVLGELRRKLLVRELTLLVTFGGADAAQTAIRYGQAWAVIGSVMPVLENTFRIRRRQVEARLDYSETEIRTMLKLELCLRMATGLLLALKAGSRALRIILQNKKKAVQANESSSL